MQNDSFIFLPGWAKVSAIIVLTITLVGALGVSVRGVVGGQGADWVEVSMSVVQVCVSGLALALVVFFSQRAISVDALVKKADEFLENDVPAAIRRLESILPGPDAIGRLANVRVRVRHARGAYGAWYDVSIDDVRLNFRFGLRMRNMIANFFLPKSTFPSVADTEKALAGTLKRAKQFGFTVDISEERQEVDGRDYVVVYLIQDLDSGFLFDTERRLSLLQQFTLLMRSACLETRRAGLALTYEGDA